MLSFQKHQQRFMDHIKDPDAHPEIEGLEDRRLQVYRELFFNNIVGFIDSGFPVLASVYPREKWLGLIRRFFIEHQCRSPYFIDISKEFVEYLSNEYQVQEQDPAFLLELAHYEWVELSLSVRKEGEVLQYWDPQQQTLPQQVTLSPLADVLSYHYPVHQISPDYLPEAGQEPTYLVVHREPNFQVKFTLINAITAHLLTVVEQQGALAVDDLLEVMVAALPQLPKEQVQAGALQVVEQMLTACILLPGGK